MATTYYAFVGGIDSIELDENDVMTVGLSATFFRNVDGTVTVNAASVPVVWNPNSALSTLNDAITDKLVDYADTAWEWELQRTKCVFPSFQKGLPI